MSAGKLLKRAQRLGAAGFRVHPLHLKDGQVCRVNGWPEKATSDADAIAKLWHGRDVVAIAVATGEDWTVVDLDVPGDSHEHDGAASLKAAGVELPETLTIRTSSGGTHHVYRTRSGQRRNVANVEHPEHGKLLGVDVRGAGGFVKVHDVRALLDGIDRIAVAPEWLPLADESTGHTRRGSSHDLEEWLGAEVKRKPSAATRAAVKAVPLDGGTNSDLPRILRPILQATLDRRGRAWAYDTARERWTRDYPDAKYADAFDRDFARLAAEATERTPTRTFKMHPKAPKGAGVAVLDEVRDLLERHIAYPNEWASTAHALWIAHAHVVRAFTCSPRIAFVSPEKGSGKTRALEVTNELTPRAMIVVNASTSAIFRSLSDDDLPTLLFDEVDAVFLGKSESAEELRGMLNSGYRSGAYALRSAVRQREIVVEQWPTYSAVALAGLGALPDTLQSRSIVVHMKRRAPGTRIEPWRDRIHAPIARELRGRLASYMGRIERRLRDAEPALPHGVDDREADLWEPLLAIADMVGGTWPDRSRDAAVAAVAERHSGPATLGVQLLDDVRRVLGSRDRIRTENLLGELIALDESPWGALRGQPIDSRFLAKTLGKYEIHPTTHRFEDGTARGYRRTDFFDAWARYLAPDGELSHTFDRTERSTR